MEELFQNHDSISDTDTFEEADQLAAKHAGDQFTFQNLI